MYSEEKDLASRRRDRTPHYFFMHALCRNKKLDVDYVPAEHKVDVSSLHKDHDVVLIAHFEPAVVVALSGIENSSIPVIAFAGDPHRIKKHDMLAYHKKHDMLAYHKKLKVDYCFDKYASSAFYKYYPKHYKYEAIPFGVEPSLYSNLRPYDDRLYDKIAISGIIEHDLDFVRKVYWRCIRRASPVLLPGYHYRLRTICNALPYTIHTQRIQPGQGTRDLPAVLSRYRAAIAATTTFPTIKYMETPAAGCLTFMEITEENDGQYLGYEDGKTAIFINEHNYECKFKEFLENPLDQEWERIAQAGQKYTLEHLTNDNATDKLFLLMRKVIGE